MAKKNIYTYSQNPEKQKGIAQKQGMEAEVWWW